MVGGNGGGLLKIVYWCQEGRREGVCVWCRAFVQQQ